jgi:hypothetical protein
MNTHEDDREQAEYLREWDRQHPRTLRPLFLMLLGTALIALTMAVAYSANAATAKLTCTPPTKNTDGTNITAALTYKAYWGTSATSLPNTSTMQGPGCAGSVVVPDPAPGTSVTYYFAVTAIADGMESAKSSVAQKTYTTPKPTPQPPVLTTVGGDVFAASPNWTNFSWKLGAKAGTVAKDIKCDATRKIGEDFYRVTSGIKWAGSKKSYVVARCREQV